MVAWMFKQRLINACFGNVLLKLPTSIAAMSAKQTHFEFFCVAILYTCKYTIM